MNIERSDYGTMPDGEKIERFTLANGTLSAAVINYGATIVALEAPDRRGQRANLLLHRDSLADYLAANPYFGSTVGRFANRIAKGRFTLDGHEYTLATNNGPNHLHGGVHGFGVRVWKAEPFATANHVGVTFTLISADGDEGYPGTLTAKVSYTMAASNELRLDYEATTDKPTIVNLTNHAYWNLAGSGVGTVLNHEIEINADAYVPVDDTAIPLGDLRPVDGSIMNLNAPIRVGDRVKQVPGPKPGGFDHCYVLNQETPHALTFAALLYDPASGRTLEVFTTEPGLQFYSGNFLDGKVSGGGVPYPQYAGLCLEANHLPDSPNHSNFPSTVLRPGDVYRQTTVWKFGVR